jgi:hypothetical protein
MARLVGIPRTPRNALHQCRRPRAVSNGFVAIYQPDPISAASSPPISHGIARRALAATNSPGTSPRHREALAVTAHRERSRSHGFMGERSRSHKSPGVAPAGPEQRELLVLKPSGGPGHDRHHSAQPGPRHHTRTPALRVATIVMASHCCSPPARLRSTGSPGFGSEGGDGGRLGRLRCFAFSCRVPQRLSCQTSGPRRVRDGDRRGMRSAHPESHMTALALVCHSATGCPGTSFRVARGD